MLIVWVYPHLYRNTHSLLSEVRKNITAEKKYSAEFVLEWENWLSEWLECHKQCLSSAENLTSHFFVHRDDRLHLCTGKRRKFMHAPLKMFPYIKLIVSGSSLLLLLQSLSPLCIFEWKGISHGWGVKLHSQHFSGICLAIFFLLWH